MEPTNLPTYYPTISNQYNYTNCNNSCPEQTSQAKHYAGLIIMGICIGLVMIVILWSCYKQWNIPHARPFHDGDIEAITADEVTWVERNPTNQHPYTVSKENIQYEIIQSK